MNASESWLYIAVFTFGAAFGMLIDFILWILEERGK